MELVRTDLLNGDDDKNPFSFKLDLSYTALAIIATLGAFSGGIGVAQLLKMGQRPAQSTTNKVDVD